MMRSQSLDLKRIGSSISAPIFGLTGRTLFLLVCFALFLGGSMPVALGQDEDASTIVDFQRDIVPIFVEHCLECHNEDDAKNDFRIDDPEYVMSYVEANDVESSTMFVDYMLSDDPDYVMPPVKQGGRLSPDKLALVRVWIEEGANWPEDASFVTDAAGDETEKAVEPAPAVPQTLTERVWAFQGFFHPATVHFPIALFSFGALFVVLGWVWPSAGKQIPLACLLLGAPSAVAATAMGFAFATEQGYGSWSKVDMDSEVFWHRWSGVIVSALAVIFALIALRTLKGNNEKLVRVWKFGLLLIAALVGLVGHQGGELSYGEDFYPRAFRILFAQAEPGEEAVVEEPVGDEAEVSAEGSADAAEAAGENAESSDSDRESETTESGESEASDSAGTAEAEEAEGS